MKIKAFEAFSGIGTQSMGLERSKLDFEVVGTSEWDYNAVLAYEAIHVPNPKDFASKSNDKRITKYLNKLGISSNGKDPLTEIQVQRLGPKKRAQIYNAFKNTKNLGSIVNLNLDRLPDFNFFTYSFPCQDISLAGNMKGLEEGSDTRSSLLWECTKIIEHSKPKYLMLGNVKNLVGKKFKKDFDSWIDSWIDYLDNLGYTTYWDVLNAKDYGVPQNRERVFAISILGEHEPYLFPDKHETVPRLRDILEKRVDEKFYLSDEIAKRFEFNEPKDDKQLSSIEVETPKQTRLFGIYDKDGVRRQAGAVWDKDGLSPTVDTAQGGNRQPIILLKNATAKGYAEAGDGDGVSLSYPDSKTRRGRVQKASSPTLTTSDNVGVVDSFRLRKLTPKECYRLMGISDRYYRRSRKVSSNSQLYKQAGNAIVVNVLTELFNQLIETEV